MTENYPLFTMTESVPTLDMEEIREFLMRRPFLRPHGEDQETGQLAVVSRLTWCAIKYRRGIRADVQRELSLIIHGYRLAR